MIGAKGFRAREATANYKRRNRKLQTDEVRAARYANLHGNADESAPAAAPVEPVEPAAPVQPEAEVKTETPAEGQQTEPTGEAEGADTAGDEGDVADEGAPEGDANTADKSTKKKAGKAKK
jgi:hypothetical protein